MTTTMEPRRCTLEDIGTVEGGDDAEAVLAPMRAYFAQFCAPVIPPTANFAEAARCICGVALTGMLGTFRYGLAHGEGACSACGHPGRADHYVHDESGEEMLRLNRFPLLYHPSVLEPR